MAFRNRFDRIPRTGIWTLLAILLFISMRYIFPERPIDYTGPRALVDAAFALGLLTIVMILGTAIGQKIISWLRLGDLNGHDRSVFSLVIGLGILAYGVLGLGLVGLLEPGMIFLWLAFAGMWCWNEWTNIIVGIPYVWASELSALYRASLGRKVFLIGSGLLILFTTIQAMAPPWAYDGLMYHLQGPKLFLRAGRIGFLPDVWGANGPFTIEMLYTIGLAFGSDVFANLLHLTFAIILVISTILFGERFLKKGQGWVAAWIFLGIPIFPIWASFAYSDMAWAVYEFMGVYALFLYTKTNRIPWLAVCGVLIGFALGSKYMAIAGAGVLGLAVIWYGLKRGLKIAGLNSVIYGSTAFLVGCPWYLKNWWWTGNPLFPLFFRSGGWSTERLNSLMVYLRSYGTGNTVWDNILSAWNLYAHPSRFATMSANIEMLSLLFPLVVFLPLVYPSTITLSLGGLTLFRYVGWLLGSHQTRFLLPIFPELSLLTGCVLVGLTDRAAFRRLGRILVPGLLGGMFVVTLFYSAIHFYGFQPLSVVIGLESKDSFLLRAATSYPAMRFIKSHVPPQDRVLMLWDGTGYYCDERCLPDTEHSRWTLLTKAIPDVTLLASYLRKEKIAYILFNSADLDLIVQHDPTGEHRRAAIFFLDEFRPVCTREVHTDRWIQVYQITCN